MRRLEVITGTGRRRRFSADDKARIIEETLVPGAVVSEVARRHGLVAAAVVHLAPASAAAGRERRGSEAPHVRAGGRGSVHCRRRGSPRQRRAAGRRPSGSGSAASSRWRSTASAVRVGRGADAKTVAAVIRALKAGT